jgi:glycosyltransferase involved in cell wall biosynthesis
VVIDDAVGLKQQGWRVGCAAQPGAWSRELADAGVRLHRLYLLSSGRYPIWLRLSVGLPLNTLLLLYIVLRWRYRCLYLHHRQLGIACEFVAHLTGVRYVFMAHVEFRGGRAATRLGKNILAVSKKVREHLITQFGVEPARIQVLPNAVKIKVMVLDVESEEELRREWGIKPTSPIAACVALLDEQKAHHVLLDAWIAVNGRFPDAVLLLAGDGPLRPSLEAQVARLGITDKVRFLGMVTDIGKVYALAHFVVLSSAWEGMPLTLLEACAYGLPAVATRVSGTPEVVRHEQNGLLVEPGDKVSLGQAIIRLLENDPLRRRLGAAAAEMSLTQFDPDQRLRKLIQYLWAVAT